LFLAGHVDGEQQPLLIPSGHDIHALWGVVQFREAREPIFIPQFDTRRLPRRRGISARRGKTEQETGGNKLRRHRMQISSSHTFEFGISNLFRISDFEIRILNRRGMLAQKVGELILVQMVFHDKAQFNDIQIGVVGIKLWL
jgi:hypothetical protein